MPPGCCIVGDPRTSAPDRPPAGRPPQEDCHQKIDDLFSGKLYLIGIAAIVVAVIMVSRVQGWLGGISSAPGGPRVNGPPARPSLQIFEMILSMVLCCGIRNSSVY